MPYANPTHPQIHNSGYVEYIDVFAKEGVKPSAGIPNYLLLFDTFHGNDPLEFLDSSTPIKMYQKICMYILGGECTIEVNGEEVCVKKDSLITIMPESITKTKSVSSDFQYFMFVIYPKLSNLTYFDLGITYSNAQLSLRHFVSQVPREYMQSVLNIYNEIKRDLLNPTYEFQPIFLRCFLNALYIENINIHNYNPMPLSGNNHSRQYDVYCRFLSALNKYSIEHRSVQFYAKLLGISSKYLSFVSISYSKKNASTWIDESVIQKAKALMIVHRYTYTETSEIMHFPTVCSFSRFFKRVTGITPKEFVKSQR